MRYIRSLFFAALCIASSLNSTRDAQRHALAEAEAIERNLLNTEDMLMVNHLRNQGIFVDTSGAAKHTD